MSWTAGESISSTLLRNDTSLNGISAVAMAKERVVVACEIFESSTSGITTTLKINKINCNTNNYSSLEGTPLSNVCKLFSNIVYLQDKIYVVGYFTGEGGIFCLRIFVTSICDRRNEWSCIHKRNSRFGGPVLPPPGKNMVGIDDYLYLFDLQINNMGRYNIIRDKWEVLPPIPIPTQIPILITRFFNTAVRCGNSIYLIGEKRHRFSSILSTSIDVFDIITQKWKTVDKPTPVPRPRKLYAAVSVNERYIVVIGCKNPQSKTLPVSDSQILDSFSNIWYTSECNMFAKRFGCTVIAHDGQDPQLTVIGGQNEKFEQLCSVEKISIYRLQPKLLPIWQPELHQYYCVQTKKLVIFMLQAVRRGKFHIPKDVLIDHIFPYACSPLFYQGSLSV